MKVNRVNVDDVVNAYRSSGFDPNGSYTGLSEIDETPTQDADDL